MVDKILPVILFDLKLFFKETVEQHANEPSIASVSSMEKSNSPAELQEEVHRLLNMEGKGCKAFSTDLVPSQTSHHGIITPALVQNRKEQARKLNVDG